MHIVLVKLCFSYDELKHEPGKWEKLLYIPDHIILRNQGLRTCVYCIKYDRMQAKQIVMQIAEWMH